MTRTFLILLILLPAVALGATMQNDSESIDLPTDAGVQVGGGGDGGGGGDSGSGTFSTGSGDDGGGGEGGASGTQESAGGAQGSNGGAGSGSGIEASVSVTGSGNATTSAEGTSILTSLIESGALTILGSEGGRGGAGGTGGSIGGSSGGSSGTIVISGTTLRDTLSRRGISRLRVFGWDEAAIAEETERLTAEAAFTPRDVSLIASSAILANQNIQEVRLSDGRLELTYLSNGWLLWFIPITFTVEIRIDARAPQGQRVFVEFPWYRWFTWVEVSPRELAADIDASIVGALASGVDANVAQAMLFKSVTTVLEGASDALPTTLR